MHVFVSYYFNNIVMKFAWFTSLPITQRSPDSAFPMHENPEVLRALLSDQRMSLLMNTAQDNIPRSFIWLYHPGYKSPLVFTKLGKNSKLILPLDFNFNSLSDSGPFEYQSFPLSKKTKDNGNMQQAWCFAVKPTLGFTNSLLHNSRVLCMKRGGEADLSHPPFLLFMTAIGERLSRVSHTCFF